MKKSAPDHRDDTPDYLVSHEPMSTEVCDAIERIALTVPTAPEFEEEDSARGPGWGNRGDCPVCGAHQWAGTEAVTEEAWWDHAENTHGRSRVLAECDARRQVVALHQPGGQYVWGDGPACAECGDVVTVSWPCQTLRLLALPYADRPGYREEWRP